MITNEIDSSTSGVALLTPSQSSVMGKDDFLNLLITQLQNQDPLKPTDSTEFTAQLAQFSSLEQLGNVNDNLAELKNFQASINNSQAVSLIGKTVTANGNSVQLSDDRPAQCDFKLDDDAVLVVANIYDRTGKFVTDFESQNLSAGQHSLLWDGTDENGKPMANGNYTFEILAADANGRDIDTTTFFSGTVDKVTFANNTSYLICGNQKIALGDVMEVAASEKTAEIVNPESESANAESQSSNPLINGGK
ncbi:Flagellar basal-body rod modification protein FlgD [Olavius sp. associated proteobacterium Delta 1]|nr:Flagellar basal-body rod modification protein FlgD [Olavius sp. associated proteobacterium Delta 1]